jgi:hypothetical protein
MSEVLHRTKLEHITSVELGRYSITAWIHDPDLSAVDGVPKEYWKVVGDTVSEMSQAEKDVVDASGLDANKVLRRKQVNARTDQLVDAGFPFDDGSGVKVYSMSLHAQSRAEGVFQLQSNPAFTWPVDWPTTDDTHYSSFADWAEFEPFYLTMAYYLRIAIASAKPLREAINAATTQAELDAVVDSR